MTGLPTPQPDYNCRECHNAGSVTSRLVVGPLGKTFTGGDDKLWEEA